MDNSDAIEKKLYHKTIEILYNSKHHCLILINKVTNIKTYLYYHFIFL